MRYRIESDVELSSDWLPAEVFAPVCPDRAMAVAAAVEGIDDPGLGEVRVLEASSGAMVRRSSAEEHETAVDEEGW